MEKPLAEEFRPKTLDEVVGQHHLLDKGKLMRKVVESGRISNMIFYGPPGTGHKPSTPRSSGRVYSRWAWRRSS